MAKDGAPSGVESMCRGDPRIESPLPFSSLDSVVFFLGEQRGLPFSITETGGSWGGMAFLGFY